jgi:gamma-glutamylcyclotransferase (GGCT)/AIG2-like uncharacterized protein YtfP
MYYFAYGSNLSQKQMLALCPDALAKFPATLPNYKLVFAGWSRKWGGGVASVKPTKGEKVVGGVYEITERCLRTLDRHEGCPTVYSHVNIRVFTELGDIIEAVTFVKAEQSEETAPSPQYLAAIRQGYKDWGIV